MKQLTKEELRQMIQEVIKIDKEPNEADWMEELLIRQTSKNDLVSDYVSTLTTYFFYLRQSELEEDYELSQLIITALDIEEKNFQLIAKSYCGWYLGEQTAAEIKSIRIELNQMYKVDGEE